MPLFCHPGQGTTNHVHPPPLGAYSKSYNREEKWREGFHNGLEPSDRSYSHSNNSHLEPIASRAPASHPFFSSSSFASSWFQSVSSWAHPSTSFTPKTTTLETSINSVDAISRPLGEYWHVGDNKYSKLNKSFQSELNPIGVDHGFAIFPKGSYHAESRPAIDINLNEELPKSMGNGNVIMQDLNVADGKSEAEDNLAALPWLKSKRVHVDDVTDTRRSEQLRELSYHHASSNELCSKNGTVRDLNQLMSTPCDSATLGDEGTAPSQTVKKILGFPIIDRDVCQNEISSASESVNCFPERKNGTIDINVACEPDEQIAAEDLTMEKEKQEKDTPKKDHIDLNFCVSDSEDPSPPFYDRSETSAKINLEIDLEALVFLESENDSLISEEETLNEVSLQPFEDQTKEKVQDEEVLRDAAETLVDLSSCPIVTDTDGNNIRLLHEASSFEGALLLLVNAISSDSKEKDDFEAMALELVETKEEDYMPKPFLPDVENIEARPLQTRTRRGHARRGRQWRDFQRDVLPGLASLSRHETTEDLQIFGGMMRATGHTWNSGLTRRNGARNGGGRGRRRAVVETVVETVPPMVEKLSSIEAGLEERSLTGWGKTTRRPRRQRCPSGNLPSAMVLT